MAIINHGYKSYISKKKPFISKNNAKQRLTWCKKYITKDSSYWENVLFSDESLILLNKNSLQYKHRRFHWSSANGPQYIRPTVRHPISVMIWGCFSSNCNQN